jgi:hypothetical protein
MQKELVATFDLGLNIGDVALQKMGLKKRFHRFLVDDGQGITGTLYIPKNETVPDTVTIRLKTKGEDQKRDSQGER